MPDGQLYLCATPIGNLGDITIRALETIKQADLIAAEDTRHTRKLLSHYDISTPLVSYHRHNEKQRGAELLELLQAGKNIVLVSDAGMPGISDPGEFLVRMAVNQGIKITPLPGPSAVITALAISGLATTAFVFEGFLPRKNRERREKLATLKLECRTMVFFEAPHRIRETLQDMYQEWGLRQVAVCRELTKRFEEVLRGTLAEARQHFEQVEPKGEFCIVVEGAGHKEEETVANAVLVQEVVDLQERGCSLKDAAKEVSARYGLSRREIYNLVIQETEIK